MKDQKKRNTRRRYDSEFKLNILKLNSDGRSISSLSRSFGVNENVLYRWRKMASEPSKKSTNRMDLSIFTLGKKLTEYCIKHSIKIGFSFSKNCFISTA